MIRSKKLAATFLGLLAVSCGGSPSPSGLGSTEDPIVNGFTVDPNVGPYLGVVWLGDGLQFGSGVLLRNDWVLTARHVFYLRADDTRNPTPGTPYPLQGQLFQVKAPGDLDVEPTSPPQQTANVDRVLFTRLGPRLDIALAHIDTPFSVLGAPNSHRLNFYQGPFSAQAAPNGLVNAQVMCFGYGAFQANQGSAEQLLAGTSIVHSVNGTSASDDVVIDASLNIFTDLVPGKTGQIPTAGDSGGPTFFGPGLLGIQALRDADGASFAEIVQSDQFRAWAEQIMFGIASSEFDDATSVFTAGSDMLVRFPPNGRNFALIMDTREGGPGGRLVPVITQAPVIPPDLAPTVNSGGFTFQVGARGVGEFNGDNMSDIVVSFESTMPSGTPVQFVFAYVSNGPNQRTPVGLFGFDNTGRWEISSVPDLDGNGMSDLLWRNEQFPGVYAVTYLVPSVLGTPTPATSFLLPPFPQRDTAGNDIPNSRDPAWRLAGAGDFDRMEVNAITNQVRDLTAADLVWHNQTTGAIEIWSMAVTQGTYAPRERFALGSRDPSQFEVVAFGDYTRDGTPDIVWRNQLTGALDIWAIDVDAFTGAPSRTEFPIELVGGAQAVIPMDFAFVGPR